MTKIPPPPPLTLQQKVQRERKNRIVRTTTRWVNYSRREIMELMRK